MKRYRFSDLDSTGPEHVASRIIPGHRLAVGGLSFHTPGQRTHADEDVHVHGDCEVSCIMQGRGWIELNGNCEPVSAGDILVIEPGENHHFIGDPDYPIVNLWFHASDQGNPKQYPEG